MTNRAVFLDRDGTIAEDVHYCRRPEDFRLFPNTAKAIGCKTILLRNSPQEDMSISPDYIVSDLLEATQYVLQWENKE